KLRELLGRTIILKQNVHEMIKLVQRFNCAISYPYSTVSKIPYKDLCVRLSDIPRLLYNRMDLYIPCVTGKAVEEGRYADMVFVHTLNPEQTQAAVMGNQPSFKPRKCVNCRMHGKCEGIFPEYVKLFGDKEFKPR
ncbi:MAG TPA: hypothetical protein DCL44_07465, partial [Elusimicrobia bacterium]|nr:hypothetical protein [Elusimicrobiota bacterium]